GWPALPAAAEWLAGEWYLAGPARPEKTSAARTGARTLALKLLQKVAEDADTREIEAIFRQEPVLAYHLLRLVNSLSVGVGRTISSFSQAILILGRQQLKRWLNLMLFAANRDDPRAPMLLARVAVRARSMELLARTSGFDRAMQEYAFMTGMFSLLGCLFGMPLSEVLQPLKLHVSLTDALLHRQGRLGLLLNIVERTEYAGAAEKAGLDEQLVRLGLGIDDHILIAIDAYQWMLAVIHAQDTVNV
ncbi:MAG: HDOD domain-containing protein, partial [Propionivibrio sp.]